MAGNEHRGRGGYSSICPSSNAAMAQIVEREVHDLCSLARSSEVIFKFQFVDRLPDHREHEPVVIGDLRDHF